MTTNSLSDKKIFLPILDNGNGDVKANWAICMMAAFNGLTVHVTRASDSHAGRGMNKIANDFLATDCDVMLVIDADIHFTAQNIHDILSHDVPLVYGVYPKKEDHPTECLATWPDGLREQQGGRLVEVRRAGRGFMCVKREVFEMLRDAGVAPAYYNHGRTEYEFFKSGVVYSEMSARTNEATRHINDAEWISEDWYFCEDCRKIGVKTLVDPQIVLKHEGAKVYAFDKERIQPVYRPDRVKSWQDIPGWFDFAPVYDLIASKLGPGGRFVEVGSWLGKSIGYMHSIVSAKQLPDEKPIALFAVDTFKGTPDGKDAGAYADLVASAGGNVRQLFDANMRAIGAASVMVDEMESLQAASQWEDGTLDAVFIDASHEYADVKADIGAWLPKIRKGGIIAGHDVNLDDVRKAVFETFGQGAGKPYPKEGEYEPDFLKPLWHRDGNCWLYTIPE